MGSNAGHVAWGARGAGVPIQSFEGVVSDHGKANDERGKVTFVAKGVDEQALLLTFRPYTLSLLSAWWAGVGGMDWLTYPQASRGTCLLGRLMAVYCPPDRDDCAHPVRECGQHCCHFGQVSLLPEQWRSALSGAH